MKVILKQSIDHLGRTGDVVNVKPGFARNFLLPRGLVVQADENNVKMIEHHKRVLEKKRLAEKAGAEDLAQKLAQKEYTILRKVGKNDKLFGSVNANDIAELVSQSGFELKRTQVLLRDSLKELGEHQVEVRLQPDVTTKIKVIIGKEE